MVGTLAALALAFATACGPDEPRLLPLTSPIAQDHEGARVTISARIRDVRPALMRSLPSIEFAPLRESGSAPEGFLDFELVGLRGEPGSVRVEFAATDGSLPALREPRPMTIRVRIGHFGDAERERSLARRMAREALTLGDDGS
ncbi:MAG: hypothetical protein JNK58_07225 [Phycisphaerae bacterium]|nr:hypothetical protein [Phycisphaerae bacterium]